MSGAKTAKQKLLIRTATGGSLLIVLLLLLAWTDRAGNGWPVWVAAMPISALAVLEVTRMGKLGQRLSALPMWVSLLFAGGVAAHQLTEGASASFVTITAVAASALLPALAAPAKARRLQLACHLWIVPPLLLLTAVHARHGVLGLTALLLLSKVGDIAGYYFGQAFGRHHPFPKLSPGKTTEGCSASLVAAVLLGAILHLAFDWGAGGDLGLVGCLAAAGLINLASQGGDLIESSAKRFAGVKDSSGWVGASGGVLDVIDSLLLSVPVALVSWLWLAP